MATDRITRRGFVGAVGVTAGSAAVLGASGQAVAANDKIRLGIIGSGSRGMQVLETFLANPEVDIVAVADVDDKHAEHCAEHVKKKRGNEPVTGRDYHAMLDRKDVDAVIIATPDHWHALPAIEAVLAGKDVYVEKPVAHNVAEGQAMLRAARKTNKVMAVGTQQRSSSHFQEAVETVRSGKLGKVFWVQTWNYENISPVGIGRPSDTEPPASVDYDRWLGPAPKRAFNPNRFHLLFRWFSDYAGGMMSDWGVHLNDIVLWALDAKGPEAVTSTGGILTSDDNRDTPDTLQVVYDFPGCTLTYSMRKGNGLALNGHDYGILFCGTDGSLLLDRAGFEIIPDKIILPYGIKMAQGDRPLRKIELEGRKVKGVDGQGPHIRNFLDCLTSRERPTCDIEIAHRSTNTCHLGNIAFKLGRKLVWDNATESFKNDNEANALLSREPRRGYELPKV
ncbi:Gfo/Idh/MocA family protein [Singulisphaera acidiphila]|uniref:Putative dehydrogenase n=1 Tax=Singulisphaera acidiphila (strain ATCC BAA-1392 / DSM 18658 / VKM B-2454 / MOB10) TaxID=886293 RepID=L0D974_SINAD|nr:Gfo/Idh/MocA family oxidoreductase [Singulisphaera acidiphila]AGA25410.1 putative dehydrogenase [Singulisphaera acidiphila DSM 18658]